MGLKFSDDWVTSLNPNDQRVFANVNKEDVIRSVFANTKQVVIKTDATNGGLLTAANGDGTTVEVTKGLHQDTQFSHNPRDKHRSSNFHITVNFNGTRHVYLAETAINNAWRIREVT